MPPEQKLLLGEELFAYACSITMAGIRNQFPDADEAERRRILQQRLELQRMLEARLDSGGKFDGACGRCALGSGRPLSAGRLLFQQLPPLHRCGLASGKLQVNAALAGDLEN
jgi:hypothetical protein